MPHPNTLLPRLAVAITLAAALLLGAAPASGHEDGESTAPPLRVAVVDVQTAFSQLDEAEAIQSNHRREVQELQATQREKAGEVKALQEELGLLGNAGPDSREMQQELIEKAAFLQAWMELQTKRVKADLGRELEAVRAKILQTVSELAESEGFDLVLNRRSVVKTSEDEPKSAQQSTVPIVLFASDTADLTQRLVEQMNTDFASRSMTEPARESDAEPAPDSATQDDEESEAETPAPPAAAPSSPPSAPLP